MDKSKLTPAVVIIGRFQPPTDAHYMLVNKAKKFIRENKRYGLFIKPIIVIIDGKESSKDKHINPLSFEERKYFIENSNRANGVLILHAKNAFDAFVTVIESGYSPRFIGAGSDRAPGYIDLLNNKFSDSGEKFEVLPGILERHSFKNKKDVEKILNDTDEKIPVSSISGSLARRAVELNFFDEFVEIVGLSKNIPAAKQLFNKLRKSLEVQS